MEKRKRWVKAIMVLLLAGIFTGVGAQMVPATKEAPVRMIPEDFSRLAEDARTGVVNIRTVKKMQNGGPVFRHFFGNPFRGNNPFEEFFRQYRPNSFPRVFKQQSLGSGFILDRKGHIVTNNHVIDGAEKIKVKLASGKEFDAKVIGRDPKTDLALIKIDSSDDLNPLPLGDSDSLRVGTWVVAIGSPFGLEQTVTAGIVSAKGRVIGAGPYDDFIQTDASINPGNSGGPLFNLKGEVIGINTAMMSRGGGNDGIGFAIPINLARGVIEQLKNGGKVTRGWLGVGIQELTPELAEYYSVKDQKGVLVTQVFKGDPADKGGIKPGDVIVDVNGKKVSSSRELSRTIADSPVDKEAAITILRDGDEKTIHVKLTTRNDSDAPVKLTSESSKGLGLQLEELAPETARHMGLPEDEKGLVVNTVDPGGKGASAGIQQGDLIKEINRKSIRTVGDYNDQIEKTDSGDDLNILIKRARTGLLLVKVTA